MRNGLIGQRGVTLVEVLVALVVLSIGMLGVASLFTVTLRSGGSAIQRTQAVGLASSMADRIRANRRAGNGYTASAVAADNKCSANTCSEAEMAKNDIYLWKQEIANAFPGGGATGTIGYTAPATALDPAQYSVKIAWKEQGRKAGENSQTLSYQLDFQVPTN